MRDYIRSTTLRNGRSLGSHQLHRKCLLTDREGRASIIWPQSHISHLVADAELKK